MSLDPEEARLKSFSIFMPDALRKMTNARKENLKFVQYTSAEAAYNIIKNKELWLRNTNSMNDYSEVKYGEECLLKSYNNQKIGGKLKVLLNDLFPGFAENFEYLFNSWLPHFKTSTYLACVSEHLHTEDTYGRLSMWRAYGGESSVAIVVNQEALLSESDIFSAYTYPVSYLDFDDFNSRFFHLIEKLESEKKFLIEIGADDVRDYLFEAFKYYVLCTKHPGFSEEREWRIVYNPALESSVNMGTSVETINGIPQIVCKLPLKDFSKEGLAGVSIPDLINKIILGPNDHQVILGKSFARILEEAGCENSCDKIILSGIPLR